MSPANQQVNPKLDLMIIRKIKEQVKDLKTWLNYVNFLSIRSVPLVVSGGWY